MFARQNQLWHIRLNCAIHFYFFVSIVSHQRQRGTEWRLFKPDFVSSERISIKTLLHRCIVLATPETRISEAITTIIFRINEYTISNAIVFHGDAPQTVHKMPWRARRCTKKFISVFAVGCDEIASKTAAAFDFNSEFIVSIMFADVVRPVVRRL